MAIIQHAVWLYHRFPFSYRNVLELLHQRGIQVSHEALRDWCMKFGPLFAEDLRHREPRRDVYKRGRHPTLALESRRRVRIRARYPPPAASGHRSDEGLLYSTAKVRLKTLSTVEADQRKSAVGQPFPV